MLKSCCKLQLQLLLLLELDRHTVSKAIDIIRVCLPTCVRYSLAARPNPNATVGQAAKRTGGQWDRPSNAARKY